jgi:hypothetical protein
MQKNDDNTAYSLIDLNDTRAVSGEESVAVGGPIDVGDGVEATDAIPNDRIFPMTASVGQAVADAEGGSGQDEIIADTLKLPSESCLQASAVYDSVSPVQNGASTGGAAGDDVNAYIYNPNAF